MPDQSITQILNSAGLIKGLAENEIELLSLIGIKYNFKKGSTIIKEGEPSRDLFIVAKGEVSIKLSLPMTYFREEVIAKLESGDVLGEFSLVSGKPRSASVNADTDVTLLSFEYEKLINLLEENTRIGYIVMRNIGEIMTKKIERNHKLNRKMMLGW